MQLAAVLNGGFQPKRYRPAGTANWSGHLPFAADLTIAVRPGLLVELGTQSGDSYFGFCQAVRENNIACACYAVNSWGAEAQAGSCDENIYQEVKAYNSAHYPDFSHLLRSMLDEAITKFSDESVDLLHIRSSHTFQAASHDFHSWMSKVKPGGVILIHEVMIRDTDFGVWKLWDELTFAGKHFIFRHNGGLGVFRKPGHYVADNPFFDTLFDSPPETREHVRKFYALCATKLEHEHERANGHDVPEREIVAFIHPFGDGGYTGETAIKVDVKPERWEHISTEIVQGTGNGPLRIDPAEQPSLIDVSCIVLRRSADGEVLWSAKGSDELATLSLGGTLVRVNEWRQRDFCRFFSYGADPQLLLPTLDPRRFDQPLVLEMWLRIQTDMASLLPILQDADEQRRRIQTLESALQEVQSGAAVNHQAATTELVALTQQRDTLAGERDALVAKLRRIQSDLYVCKTDLKHKTAEEVRLHSELAHARQQLAASERVLHEALTSRSWRITSPIRRLSKLLGAQH